MNGNSTVYEDAGDSLDYQQGAYVLTNVSLDVGVTLLRQGQYT
eukprot:COSAG06_NODE_189_length_20763_cov_8.677376_17_plen_43_part_00